MLNNSSVSPLSGIDVSFSGYVERKKQDESIHLINNIPDYAFEYDYEIRQKLMNIPYFFSVCKKITSTIVTREIQLMNQCGVAVSQNQYGEIYQMGLDCAKRLGIGIPNIFVMNNSTINAYTIATDDVNPIIVLFSGLVERFSPAELKCVIAHECGHIHNNHTVFRTVINAIASETCGRIGALITGAYVDLMNFWIRVGEVTADRAALICADDPEDTLNVHKKLLSGAMFNNNYDINVEELRKQLEHTMGNPSKLMELTRSHPSSIRRIFADMEFQECEIFYRWRPDLKTPDTLMRSKKETDERCKKIINVLNNN